MKQRKVLARQQRRSAVFQKQKETVHAVKAPGSRKKPWPEGQPERERRRKAHYAGR